jgi:hypothetical protein
MIFRLKEERAMLIPIQGVLPGRGQAVSERLRSRLAGWIENGGNAGPFGQANLRWRMARRWPHSAKLGNNPTFISAVRCRSIHPSSIAMAAPMARMWICRDAGAGDEYFVRSDLS